jgi:hypothetical protein
MGLPLPAFAHVAVGPLVARQDEGGVHKANVCAARSPDKGESDGIEGSGTPVATIASQGHSASRSVASGCFGENGPAKLAANY